MEGENPFDGPSIEFDPYAVLNLSRDCTNEEIMASYRRMAKTYHPDRQSSSNLSTNLV